ncbi:MAG TPA: bifunctional methylenetetrahydrofolate dehydrogenase/methenyltetrahydrofolate cyclohydrolase, partial [Rhodospirillaceae bacterium]|nr:bifunctional methylenetetrahydrofolate dehydrogenase/methenyltetrahydrofolate cyclohydrolase [Rhodospirillaceae bacterium]
MTHSAQIIDGKLISAALMDDIAAQVAALDVKPDVKPALAVILVGDDPASHVYVGNKIKACAKTGIRSIEHRLPETATNEDIERVIADLNADENVHGILLQLPLPKGLDSDRLVQMISPAKDVDGLNILNV